MADSQQMITLSLTASSGGRQIVKVSQDVTVEQLYERAAEVFQAPVSQIKAGFPPVALENTPKTLEQAGIRNQERLVVTLAEAAAASKKKKKTTVAASPRGKPKRAAAVAATASFAETIQQQDKLMKQETKKKKTSPKKSSSQQKKKKPRFTAAATTGRRLQDGAVVAAPRRRQKLQSDQEQPEDAVASALLSAASGDSSRSGRLMRKGWKQAVQSAYEQNQAAARLAAVASTKVHFELSQQSLKVTYPKGLQGRGNFTDTVDALPFEVLKSVVGSIHPVHPETLRPSNLALLSPRVLWNLMYHYKDDDNITTVEEALQELQPDLDWTFLRRRRQQLSEKARENKRQEQEDATANNYQAAAEAIESVEQAMEQVHAFDSSQRQARVLQAAQKRLVWNVVTPTELDEDELSECVEKCPVAHCDTADIVKELVSVCKIHNWRELANTNTETLSNQLEIGEDTVEAWIDHAQACSVEEIIVEICDGNVGAVELLRDVARSGTPKDLAAWRSIVNVLHDQLQQQQTSTSSETPTTVEPLPSPEQLQKWCNRAHQALEQFEWLEWYATPIQ